MLKRQTSRISNEILVELFSLGNLYMSDFIDDYSSDKVRVPLTMTLDKKSGLLQLKHTAPFDKMYENYWYRSGINKTMTEELKGIARKAMSLIKCERDDIALDVGCNDGTLLRYYGNSLYKVGFDPARNLERYSSKYANLIVTDYFTALAYFSKLTTKAKIITAIAMFYDLEDPHKFVNDINAVLDDEGLWIVQMSYMPLMLKQHAFDNICVKPEEIILGSNKKICDISLGDSVIGGSGTLVDVKNVMKRLYEGALVKITPAYLEPIVTTLEHPIRIVRKEYFRYNCEQTKPKPNNYEIEWVPAKDVKRGDFVVIPKLPSRHRTDNISLREFNKLESPNYRRGLLSLPLNADTAWLLGLYVAEGHTGGRKSNPYINFTLHKRETYLSDRISSIFEFLGYKANVIFYNDRNSMEVRIVCSSLAHALEEWFGKGATNKHIPNFIMSAPQEIRTSFLRGLFDGDGYIKKNKVHFHTSSRILVKQVQLLVVSLGGMLGISYVKPYPRIIRGGKVESKDSWQLRGSSKSLAKIFGYEYQGTEINHVITKEDYIFVPIKSVDSEQYSGMVYNIETDDETYLVSNAIVHNCHEHLEYYSLSSFEYLIKQHNLKIVDVELNDINGGSFRIYVRKNGSNDDLFATAPYRDVAQFRINSLLEYEKALDLNNPETYTSWFKKLQKIKEQTVSFIKSEKAKGKTIYGYGASTKGNTLLQWYGLDNTLIDAIAERNPKKYGKRTVGTNIEIRPEEEMRQTKPDYLLVLPWHFISEFRNREREYLDSGGKFIVPLPQFRVISND